jgi:predicted HicB family RNase H-like nuclease
METTKQRGGFREGSGRKKTSRNVSVAYRISENARDRISEYAAQKGLSINAAVTEIFENL